MPSPSPLPAWQRHLPNALTLARLAMTVAFVAILSIYRFPDTNTWALPTALILFIIAALTDAADGWLARRWNVVSVFGRIMDPFADKILILGAFVMLAGPQFWIENTRSVSSSAWHGQVSGVTAWMVVVILSRELLVTTIRAVLESRGVDFSAALSGKLKMIAQSIGIPLILAILIPAHGWQMEANTWNVHSPNPLHLQWCIDMGRNAQLANTVIAWIIVVATALSAIPYITRAITALRSPPGSATL